jgi:hypothetical protein
VTVAAADPDQSTGHTDNLRGQWARWNPGVPLQVLDTQDASIAGPVVAWIAVAALATVGTKVNGRVWLLLADRSLVDSRRGMSVPRSPRAHGSPLRIR